MALSIGNDHVFAAQGNQSTPYTSAATTLHANTTAIVVCITIYETGPGDGVVSDVDFGTLDLTLATITYDALSDGHLSIWYGNSPQLTSQTLVVTMGGTCTDLKCSITEIYGGQIQEESEGTPATGTVGDPTITWSASGDFSFACMLDDQTDVGKVTADQTEIYLEDVGDVVGASYDTGATAAMSWTEADGDEDWVVVGVAFEELTGTDHTKTLTDSVGVTDTITASVGHIIAFADNVGITDTIASVVGKIVTISDSVGITDVMTNVRALSKTLTENVGILDALTNKRELFKTLTENVGVTDALSNSIAHIISFTDSVGITDVLSTVITAVVNKSLEVKYDILNLVNKSLEAVYDIRNLVNKSLQAKWDILNGGAVKKIIVGLGRTAYRLTGRRIG